MAKKKRRRRLKRKFRITLRVIAIALVLWLGWLIFLLIEGWKSIDGTPLREVLTTLNVDASQGLESRQIIVKDGVVAYDVYCHPEAAQILLNAKYNGICVRIDAPLRDKRQATLYIIPENNDDCVIWQKILE